MSNGPQFKTGFLAPLPDYGAIGREASERFMNPILGVVKERAQKQLDKEKILGIGTAGATTAPGNINPYFKDGVQKALDVWQQTELDFKQNPSDANAQRVSAARGQYSSIAQDAVFGSKFILEKNLEIRSDQDLAEAGLTNFNLNLFNQKYGQTPTYEVVGDNVRVVEKGQSVAYFESTVNHVNEENLPVIQGSVEGTYKQLSSTVSDTIFVDSYQGRNTAGVKSGVLVDENAFATDFADKYNSYGKREGTMWNAVALEAYKINNIRNRGVVQKDLDAVDEIYSPLYKDVLFEGRSITKITGFDADGNPQYDVSEDELKTLVGEEMTTKDGQSFTVTEDKLMKFREAQNLHAKNAYERAKGRFSVPEATTTTTVLGPQFKPFAPRNYGENNIIQSVEVADLGQVFDIPNANRLNPVDIENTSVQVENVYMNQEGEVVAYKIGRNRELLDKLLALPNLSERQEKLLELLQSGAETITQDNNVDFFTELQGQLGRMKQKNDDTPSYSDLIDLGRDELGVGSTGTTPGATPPPTAGQTAVGGLNQSAGLDDDEEGQDGLVVPPTAATTAAAEEPLQVTPEGEVVATPQQPAVTEDPLAEKKAKIQERFAKEDEKFTRQFQAEQLAELTGQPVPRTPAQEAERRRLQAKEQQLTVEQKETKAFWSDVKKKTDGGEKFWGTRYAPEENLFRNDGINTITNEETLRQAIEAIGNPPRDSVYYDIAKGSDLLRGLTDEEIREMYKTTVAKNEGYKADGDVINVPKSGESGVTIAGLDLGRPDKGDAERKIDIISKYVTDKKQIDALKTLMRLQRSKAQAALDKLQAKGLLTKEALGLSQEDLDNITADQGDRSFADFVNKVGNETRLRELFPGNVLDKMLDVHFNVPGRVDLGAGKGRPLPKLKTMLKEEELKKKDVEDLALLYDDYYDTDSVTNKQILGRKEAAATALRNFAKTLD